MDLPYESVIKKELRIKIKRTIRDFGKERVYTSRYFFIFNNWAIRYLILVVVLFYEYHQDDGSKVELDCKGQI